MFILRYIDFIVYKINNMYKKKSNVVTYRPRKVEREDDGIAKSFHVEVRHIQGVSTQHGCSDVTESTR